MKPENRQIFTSLQKKREPVSNDILDVLADLQLTEKAIRSQKNKRVLYHIGPRPPRPVPKMKWIEEWDAQAVDRHTGERTGEYVRTGADDSWQRYWLDKPIESGVFLTPNWRAISSFHGRIGHVYALKVPEWVIKKAGGVHRYDHGSEILISEEIWNEAGNEIEFLGKSKDVDEVFEEYESSYSDTAATVNRRGTPRSPSWLNDEEMAAWKAQQERFNLSGLRATNHPEDVIKLLKPEERRKAVAAIMAKTEPEPQRVERGPRDIRGIVVPGISPALDRKDKELLALLKKHMNESSIRAAIREELTHNPIRQKLDLKIPDDLRDIHKRMKGSGKQLYVVGGAVRDTLVGKTPKDYDLVSDATPDQTIDILSRHGRLRLDLTGKAFGVVRVKTPGDNEYEIATFREDLGSGRRPTGVSFTTIDKDVLRRDLTINALFYDLDTSEVVDYVGGLEDIRNGVVRAAGGSAQDRFAEDKLRMLRAVRFAARMGFDLSSDVSQAIKDDDGLLQGEGAIKGNERITEEFKKGLKTAINPKEYIVGLNDLGLLSQVLPAIPLDITKVGDSSDSSIQIALLASSTSDLPTVQSSLKKMRYTNQDIGSIMFLMSFKDITKETAPKLKKLFNRLDLSRSFMKEFTREANISPNILSGFLTFVVSPPAADARELMSQGIKGPSLGAALEDAESEAYAQLIGESRIQLIDILLESVEEEPDMTQYVDILLSIILGALRSDRVKEEVKSMNPDEEWPSILDSEGKIFGDYENINKVRMIISVNNKDSGQVKAYYRCVPSNRSESDLVIDMNIPRMYSDPAGYKEFEKWLRFDLADALSHELQHSCDTTEMLTADIPEGEDKWLSLDHIERYYTSDAETRAHVAGILGRGREMELEGYEVDYNSLLRNDVISVFKKATSRGFNAEELGPVMSRIVDKWLNRLDDRLDALGAVDVKKKEEDKEAEAPDG